MKQNLTELKGEMEKSTNTVKGFKSSLSVFDRISKEKNLQDHRNRNELHHQPTENH